jgi:hypothetical protein
MMTYWWKKVVKIGAAVVLLLSGGPAILLQTSAQLAQSAPQRMTQSVTLAWNPSPDSNVVGYTVYYGTISQNYTGSVSVGNVSSATISGLVEGTTYYFAAASDDALNQESPLSSETSYTIPVTQPPAITEIVATNIAETGQSLTFTAIITGSNPMNCQWSFNGTSIAGATNTILTLNNVSPAQTGEYSLMVSNSVGSTNSPEMHLTVFSSTVAALTPASPVNGQFALSVSGDPSSQYVIQASSDLTNWVPEQTNFAPFTFIDTTSSQYSQRFYRTCLVIGQ